MCKIISQMVQNLRLWDVEVEVVWQVILAFEAQHPPTGSTWGGGGAEQQGGERPTSQFTICAMQVFSYIVQVFSYIVQVFSYIV